jgi:hypothetical protein
MRIIWQARGLKPKNFGTALSRSCRDLARRATPDRPRAPASFVVARDKRAIQYTLLSVVLLLEPRAAALAGMATRPRA